MNNNNLFKTKRRGFAILDMMLWMMFFAAVAVFMVPNMKKLYQYLSNIKVSRDIQKWQQRIADFKLDTGVFPSKLKDLYERPDGFAGKGWKGGYVEKDDEFPPLDPNGKMLIFNNPPQIFKDKYSSYEIISVGSEDEDSTNVSSFYSAGA